MATIEEIKLAIARLSEREQGELRDWLSELAESSWDAEIERDVTAGKLDWLADEATAEHKAGQTTKLR